MPTNPGLHPEFAMEHYPAILHRVVRSLAMVFYVTRSFKPIQVGNCLYYAVLVRPSDDFSVYLNADREVVVVISTYDTFEMRTLEAYDGFYSALESKRIDRSIRFLISNDSNIESIVRHYLNQNPEYPIVIPTTISNIINRSNDCMRDAVRRNYLLRDLFGYQNPLREETFFFGRGGTVNSVLDMMKSGQNSSLFGLRKSGKTSTIYAIQRKSKSFSASAVLIDCQNPAVHGRGYRDLLSHLIGEIRKSIGLKKVTPQLSSDLVAASEEFASYLNTILSSVKGQILLIFDEIENISPGTAASEYWRTGNDPIYFWQILRSYLQSQSDGRISICIVGTSPRILELPRINDIANPVYLYAQARFIPNLNFDETRDMVSRLGYFMGMEFPIEIITTLHEEFGGHPFFTRQICSRIHQNASLERPVTVTRRALNRARDDFSGQLESYLGDIIESLRKNYPDEYGLLLAVKSGDKDDINEYGRDAPDLISHLMGYGIVKRIGDEFHMSFKAIASVLDRIAGSETQEERLLEISRRRNSLEKWIRTELYYWSRGIDSDDIMKLFEKQLTGRRFSQLTSLEPSVLFSSERSPLYLIDVMLLLKCDKVLPHIDRNRNRIIESLDIVNKFRVDAHALSVDDASMSRVRSAFEFLESIFAPP